MGSSPLCFSLASLSSYPYLDLDVDVDVEGEEERGTKKTEKLSSLLG